MIAQRKRKSNSYYYAEDVQELLGIGINAAQKAIRSFNQELEKKGFITLRGRVPKKAFEERYGL